MMNDTELHPLAQEVSQHLSGLDQSFVMLVHCQVQEGQEAAFKKAFHRPLLETIKEEGNFTYRLIQELSEPTKFIVIEHWRDLPSLNDHLHQPYLEKLLADLESILAAPPAVTVYDEYVAV